MAQYPIPAVGQRLTAEFIASMLPLTARKASATTITSDASNNADADLTLAVEANAEYQFECMMLYDSATGADIQWAFTAPAGSSGAYWITQLSNAAAATTDDQNGSISLTGTPSAGGLGVGTQISIMMYGVFQTAGSSGNFLLNWSQRVSTASNTTLQANSFLKVLRIG